MTDTRVVVAGGGLAGLVAARHLADAGADVTVLERAPEVGGRVRSTHRDGFVLDRGFQVLFTAYPAVRRELNRDRLDVQRFTPGACIASPGDRSILSDPFRDPTSLTESLFNSRVTPGDKLRTLLMRRDLAKRAWEDIPGDPETTIRGFLDRRGFSEQFVDNFAAPFYGGISLDRTLSTSSRVFEYTFKALSTGRIGLPADGMGAISAQLERRARTSGASVATDRTVTEVEATGDPDDPSRERRVTVSTPGETYDPDAAVVATDPPTARDLTGVDAIPTEPRGCVTQYYRYDGTVDVGKLIVLNAEHARPNQVVPLSAVAPDYAPDGTSLLCGTFLGTPDADDDELATETREALESWFPERGFGSLEPIHTVRTEFAQFDQPPGFYNDLPDARDPDGPVYLAGDYTRWSSIQGAIESGRDAARAVQTDHDLGI